MEESELLTSLSSAKIDAKQKLEIYKTLNGNESHSSAKQQHLLNSLCFCLEQYNKEKLISDNIGSLNEFLILLQEKLEDMLQSNKKFHISGSIFDVINNLLKCGSTDFNITFTILDKLLLTPEWKKILFSKPLTLTELLCGTCELVISDKLALQEQSAFMTVIHQLVIMYTNQKKSQFNIKKIFQNFCDKLLVLILCTRSVFQRLLQHDNIVSEIDQLIAVVIGHRDHVANLKLMLQPVSEETPAKKAKYQVYFKQLFDVLKTSLISERKDLIIRSTPAIFKAIVVGSRSSNTSQLTNYEELQVLFKILELTQTIDVLNESTVHQIHDSFTIVQELDVYQRIDDKENKHHIKMTELMKLLENGFKDSNMNVQMKMLSIFKTMLLIDYGIVEPFLGKLWRYCLTEVEGSTIQFEQNALLEALLENFAQLRKMELLLDAFPLDTGLSCNFPHDFTVSYSEEISKLQTSQVIRLLKIFQSKMESITVKSDSNFHQFSYLLFYLLVTNASVVPENLFTKPELEEFILIVTEIGQRFVELSKTLKSEDSFGHILLLITMGVNECFMILKDLSLLPNDGDCQTIGNTLTELCKEINGADAMIKYLKVCQGLTELRFNQSISSKDQLCQINKELMSNIESVSLKEEKISTLVNNKTMWSAIAGKMLDHFEFCLMLPEDNRIVTDDAIKLLLTVFRMGDESPKRITKIIESHTVYNYPLFQSKSVEFWEETLTTTSSDEIALKRDLKKISKLKTEYLTEENWFKLFNVLYDKRPSITKHSQNNELSIVHTKLLTQMFQDAETACHSSCGVPFSNVFEHLLDTGSSITKMAPNNKDVIEVFGPLFRLMVIHLNRESEHTTNILKKIGEHLTGNESKILMVQILNVIFSDLVELVQRQFVVKSRTINNIFTLVQSTADILFEHCKELSVLCRGGLLGLVTSFCLLLEKSLQTKHVKQEKIDNCKNKIHELLKEVPQILSDDIESLTADSVTYECLNLLEFIYSKSEFATKIQDSLTYNETDVLERLILLSKNMNTELLPDVISKMILSLDTQRLTDRLLSMADRLEEHLVNDSNEFQHVNLWKHLLQCKWDKDQKNVLFEVLPKVIMVSVKTLCTKNINQSNNKRVLLKILCLAVTISKASPVTTYMSTIFNIFTNLKSLLECKSFQVDLEDLYQILSLMLFLHTSSFSTTVHCFIHAVNN
uniref:Uncharacterized protein n=2 Tax=Clytia hemisphaerica TaxID=252671 RepID=A0A7M5WJF7_9CNID